VVEFGTILEGLRNFGGGGFEHPKPPFGTPLMLSLYLLKGLHVCHTQTCSLLTE